MTMSDDEPHPFALLADPNCKVCPKIWGCSESYKVYKRAAEIVYGSKLRGCEPCSILYDAWDKIPRLRANNKLHIKCNVPLGFTGQIEPYEIWLTLPHETFHTAIELFTSVGKRPLKLLKLATRALLIFL
jgi:hypothetical protein